MANIQLVQYIQDALKKGYTYQQVRSTLVSSGWPQYEVEEAISSVYNQSVHEEVSVRTNHHVLSIVLVIGFVLLVGAGLFAITLLFPSQGGEQLTTDIVEYEVTLSSNKVEVGNKLVFTNTFRSPTKVQGYLIYPSYKIYESSTDQPVMHWEATDGVPLDGSTETRKTLLSTISPGTYYLESSALYKGERLVSRQQFVVYEKAVQPTCTDGLKNQGESDVDCGGPCKACVSCGDGVRNQGETGVDCGGPCKACMEQCESCNDYNACTLDTCHAGTCVNEPIFPCCGNYICESGETTQLCPGDCLPEIEKPIETMTRLDIINKAKRLINESKQKEAGDFCSEVPDLERKDECFSIIAFESKNSIFCTYIDGVVKRDNCYMSFANDITIQDYSVCPKITSKYLRSSCEALKMRPSPP
ncbi:hypothetical protein H6504_03230 [Candidatus Woesearchaeota archaeon]|nr:hypothetical protein [Candidatus Woesearchaeota archaeon]